MERRERRRIVFATAFTVVALPSIWILDRSDAGGSPNVASAEQPSITAGPETPIFLETNGPAQAPVIVAPATPVTTGANVNTGKASYQRYNGLTPNSCTATGVPLNQQITVVNLDNGLQLTCTNSVSRTTQANVIITIDTDLFSTIADLSDAPVPVQIDW
jgi:hypothetical protein